MQSYVLHDIWRNPARSSSSPGKSDKGVEVSSRKDAAPRSDNLGSAYKQAAQALDCTCSRGKKGLRGVQERIVKSTRSQVSIPLMRDLGIPLLSY